MEECRKYGCDDPRQKNWGSVYCGKHQLQINRERNRVKCTKSGCNELRINETTRCADHQLELKDKSLCIRKDCFDKRFKNYTMCQVHSIEKNMRNNKRQRGSAYKYKADNNSNYLLKIDHPVTVVIDTRSVEELESVRVRARS